jgi:murein DD-endopeptidase MepM/ murein hydrolase activator NlpD
VIFKNKHYTVMIVSAATSRIRKLSLSGRLLNVAVGLGSTLFCLWGLFIYDYVRIKGQVSELERLRVETRTQRIKLNSFAQQMIDVEKEMERLRRFDGLLRNAFELDKGTPGGGAKTGGLGGSGSMDLAEYPEVLEGKAKDLTVQMERDLDRLKHETGTQEASLSQLVAFIQERKSLLRATPSIWPVRGLVTSGFRKRRDPFSRRLEFHPALDIAAREGAPVRAPADGLVIAAPRLAGLGKTVTIDHGFGYTTIFGHNSRVAVNPGQRVKRGDVIAYVGNTGQSTGPHLHYELHKNGLPVDPAEYLLN